MPDSGPKIPATPLLSKPQTVRGVKKVRGQIRFQIAAKICAPTKASVGLFDGALSKRLQLEEKERVLLVGKETEKWKSKVMNAPFRTETQKAAAKVAGKLEAGFFF